jgi:hypothetical protein
MDNSKITDDIYIGDIPHADSFPARLIIVNWMTM